MNDGKKSRFAKSCEPILLVASKVVIGLASNRSRV
jgi:hypothetical protein